ncbi:MAG: hypothetical protein PHW96_00480 [Candidatus Nanoarchaeia archaeon]|nr:hypothetical protein [Candidatus Nanoarchaeia archaeon]
MPNNKENTHANNHSSHVFRNAMVIGSVVLLVSAMIYGIYLALTSSEGLLGCRVYLGVEACSMVYDPVCAKIMSSETEYEWKTFSNACNACISSDPVVGYLWGECEANNK